jgi:hypothetical protein
MKETIDSTEETPSRTGGLAPKMNSDKEFVPAFQETPSQRILWLIECYVDYPIGVDNGGLLLRQRLSTYGPSPQLNPCLHGSFNR